MIRGQEEIQGEVLEFFQKIENVYGKSLGGCLLMAYAFYLWRKKFDDENDMTLVQYDGGTRSTLKNLQWINNEEQGRNDTQNEAVPSSHFTWMWRGTEYDGNGIATAPHFQGKVKLRSLMYTNDNNGECIFEKFCLSALNHGGWNSDFVRETEIPKMAKSLDIDLSKVNGWKGYGRKKEKEEAET